MKQIIKETHAHKGATPTTTPVAPCSHDNQTYIDEETETNIQAVILCDDCGEDITEEIICLY